MIIHLVCAAEQEELTALGVHLANLPVDVRIGKMLIVAALFKCLSPILTVAATLSHRSPFVSPIDKRAAADDAKRGFASEGNQSRSDTYVIDICRRNQ